MVNYNALILESLDLEYLAESATANISTDAENIARVFFSEYGFIVPHRPLNEACTEYLLGLPSACTIPFMNSEIIALLSDSGADVTDEHAAIKNYWQEAGAALAGVISGGNKVITTTHETGQHRAFIDGWPITRTEQSAADLYLELQRLGHSLTGARLLGVSTMGRGATFKHWAER